MEYWRMLQLKIIKYNNMKTINLIIIALASCSLCVCAGEIKGTIQQVLNGQTIPAIGSVTVGVLNTTGDQLDPMQPAGEASAAGRIVRIGIDGKFSVKQVPEGAPLYISIFLDSGAGKYIMATLTVGQVMDVSQIIPDAKVNGVSFSGKIIWPTGVTFKNKTSRFLTLIGKNNNWEYVPDEEMDSPDTFKFDDIQPGTYRLGIHSTIANGDDRYDEAEITVANGMEASLLINIP